MPKVLRIINRFNLGGITYNVSYLSRFLPERYETLLIGGPEEKDEESSLFIPHSMGLNPVIVNELRRTLNPFQDLKAYLKIKRIIREYQPDIVHTHASKAGFVGRLAARHCKVPVIVHTFHGHVFSGYFPKWMSAIIQSAEKQLSKYCNAVVAISNKQKKELSELYQICKPEKIAMIPLGFDLRRFTEQQEEKRIQFRDTYSILPQEIAVGIIGRLAPVKNHQMFIEAVVKSAEISEVSFRAFVIGDGHTRKEMEQLAEKLSAPFKASRGGRPLFTFTGWIKEVDLALAGLDIVCLTSKNEGTPVSLIEAQAAGKYVLSTNVGGIEDILHRNCGMLSEPDDEKAYFRNLVHTLEHYEEIRSSMDEGRKEVLEKFNYQRLCKDMSELYDKLLESKH